MKTNRRWGSFARRVTTYMWLEPASNDCKRAALLELVLHIPRQFSDSRFQLIASFIDIVHVVDHFGGEEDDEFGASVGECFPAKSSSDNRETVQERNARTCRRMALIDDPADGNSVPILKGHLRRDVALGE